MVLTLTARGKMNNKIHQRIPPLTTSKEKTEEKAKNGQSQEEERSIFDINVKDFREIMTFNGTTQTQLAKEIGCSQQKVSDILQGLDVPVSWITCLIRICGEEQYKFILSKVRNGKRYRKRLH